MSSDQTFNFPGDPYKIQKDLMQALYSGLSQGGLIVVESPTGTGKSLSLICASLTWLRVNREKMLAKKLHVRQSVDVETDEENVPPWLRKSSEDQSEREARALIKEWCEERLVLQEQVSKLGSVNTDGTLYRTRLGSNKRKRNVEELAPQIESEDILPSVTNAEAGGDIDLRPRVLFTSRTHSQLSQMIREIRKTSFIDSFSVVTLSSRQHSCINKTVTDSKWNEGSGIDENCRKLVDSDNCHYFAHAKTLSMVFLAKPNDIEDQVSEGARIGGCPYYAAKFATTTSDVLLIPYSSILSESMRRSLNIDVTGNVVVIDEAHNLLDALCSSQSSRLEQSWLESIIEHVTLYKGNYMSVLAPRNLVSLKKICFLAKLILNWTVSCEPGTLCTVSAFFRDAGLDASVVNDVSSYLDSTDFMRKLRGFVEKSENMANSGAIYNLHGFLRSIQTTSDWDRISVREVNGCKELNFVVINSDNQFAELLKGSHAVVLAGGTMKPVDEYRTIADLAGVPFMSFVASHEVQSDRLFVGIVSKSITGEELLFTHLHRTSARCINALKDVVRNVYHSGPHGGVIMFVSSYEYAQEVNKALNNKSEPSTFTTICDHKGSRVSDILDRYKKCVAEKSPVLLISVVGGSLSEGIDFRDELCRCVILVGLPYPNRTDPILIEKMKYFDTRHKLQPTSLDGEGFYHASCMRAVNQSIGRAIRHSRDWASVLLIDERFTRRDIQDSLSDWIKTSLRNQSIDTLTLQLRSFYTAAIRTQLN